jgi:hypothetical protein
MDHMIFVPQGPLSDLLSEMKFPSVGEQVEQQMNRYASVRFRGFYLPSREDVLAFVQFAMSEPTGMFHGDVIMDESNHLLAVLN